MKKQEVLLYNLFINTAVFTNETQFVPFSSFDGKKKSVFILSPTKV
jgi:hypothetical protein